MAINVSFNGTTIHRPGFYGIPLNEKQISHNFMMAMMVKLNVIKMDEFFNSIHTQGQIDLDR